MKVTLLSLALCAAPIFSIVAWADDEVTEGQTVTDRPRPEYDPLGERVGGFVVYPGVYDQETFDSNIQATPSGARADLITSVQPSVVVKSDWGSNALNFHADSNIVRYANYANNDYTDYSIGTDGRLDVYRDARLFGNVSYAVEHLPWWSPNTFQGQGKPTEYSDTAVGLAGEKEFNHLSFRLDENFDRYAFSNVTVGSTTAAESRNDYDDQRINLRTNYEIVPGRDVYLLTGYDWRLYDTSSDLFGFNRNSTGYIAALGAKYDVTGLTFLDVFAGYRQQDYQDARLGTISGPTGGAKLTWNVTTLTTITGGVTRDIDETVLANSAGYFATVETLRVDHELLRNLLLNASIAHETDSFQGIDRTDEYYRPGVGAKYLLNEYLWLTGGYTYQTRATTQSLGTVDDHQVFIGVSAHI